MDSKELSKLAKELAPLVAQEILKDSCERIIEDIFEHKKKRDVPEDKPYKTPSGEYKYTNKSLDWTPLFTINNSALASQEDHK